MSGFFRKVLLSLCFFAAATLPSFPGILDNFDLSFYTLLEDSGTTTVGSVTYSINPFWSTSINLKSISTSKINAVQSLEDSLYIGSFDSTEIFFNMIEYHINTGISSFQLSAGAYFSFQDSLELGYFTFPNPVGLNSYKNSVSTDFAGPSLNIAQHLSTGYYSFSSEASVVPIFFFLSNQSIRIHPLLSNEGTTSYIGKGYPYLMLRMNAVFFQFLSPDVSYEMQNFSIHQLNPDSDFSDWESTVINYTVQTVSPRINLRLPIRDIGHVEIGYGKKLEWTSTKGADTIFGSTDIYRIYLDLKM
jgi:hypothetical protein